MSGQVVTMTIKEIAEAAGCHYSTVRDSVERLFPGTVHHGKECHLDAQKSAAVMFELPKRNAVGLSGKPKSDSLENRRGFSLNSKLPTGSQLHELRMIYGPQEAGKRLDMMLGLPPTMPVPLLGPPRPTWSERKAHALLGLTEDSIVTRQQLAASLNMPEQVIGRLGCRVQGRDSNAYAMSTVERIIQMIENESA